MITTEQDMVNSFSCLKKGSSSDNCNFLYNNSAIGHNSSDIISLTELKEILLLKPQIDAECEEPSRFFDGYLKYIKNHYSDHSALSHARSLLRIMELKCSQIYGHKNILAVLCEDKFITLLNDELKHLKSANHKNMVLKQLYSYYFRILYGEHPIQPLRVFVERQLRPSPSIDNKQITVVTVHPLIKSFLDYLTYDRKEKWQKRARIHLTYFLKWYADYQHIEGDIENVNVRDVTFLDLNTYKSHLESKVNCKHLVLATAQGYIQSLKSWFRYLRLSGHIFRNPAHSIPNFRITKEYKVQQKKKRKLLSDEMVEMFFNAILEHSNDILLDLAIFITLASLGVRANEVLAITKKNICLFSGQIKFLRKGGDEQILPMAGIGQLFIELHLANLKLDDGSNPIWLNQYGSPLRYEALRRRFHKYAKLSGITKDIGACHSFRRLLFTELMMSHTDMQAIRRLANHKYEKELNTYIYSKKAETDRSYEENYPDAGSDLIDNVNR